ncbi:hypothetical protein [Sporosarcina sp. FSL W7-1283]|uniref:hypothetical protein n=1 Tax=Sporosarcina sp. FSL W7-1283 TaxID=2921560 RepID=UPI0030F57E17
MFKKKRDIEIVSELEMEHIDEKYRKRESILMGVGIATTASLVTYAISSYSKANNVPESTAGMSPIIETTIEPLNVLSTTSTFDPSMIPVSLSSTDTIQTGVIADTSLNMLATVLDPVIQILVAISFPIASVIMLGACFLFMIGNSEKAWSTIFNAGLGYVLIQMSPLFLNILREVGKAV